MSINLQHFLYTLLSQSNGSGFLNLTVRSNYNEIIVISPSDRVLAETLSSIFMLSDIVLYVGIIAVIMVLGGFYKSVSTANLASHLVSVSSFSIYISIVLNLAAFSFGFSFISNHNLLLFDGTYTFSMFSQLTKIFMFILIGALYTTFESITKSTMRTLELPLLFQIVISLCSTMISSSNFALLLLAMEGFSLVLYIMTALGRNYGGITASVKYFAFGTLGSIFLFWGVVHLYVLMPSLAFDVINAMLVHIQFENSSLIASLDFATTAIAFGFMLKLGAAPTHQWVADVYSGVHMYITAFFGVFVKFILFAVFMKSAINFNCDTLLNQFILISLLIGCIMAINQTEIKRLLAYSSIVHVSFLLMGDSTSSVVYLLTYVTSSLLIFSILLTSELGGRELIYLNDMKFLRISSPYSVVCLTVGLASSAGLPPFAGFYGKFLVWSSLIEDIYLLGNTSSYIILFLSIAISLVTIYYYMRVIAYLFVGQDSQTTAALITQASDEDFYNMFVSTQGLLLVVVVFWTFLQSYVIQLAELSLYCL